MSYSKPKGLRVSFSSNKRYAFIVLFHISYSGKIIFERMVFMKKGLAIISSLALLLTGVGIGTALPQMSVYDVSAANTEGVYKGMTYTSDGSEICITGYTDDCDIYNLVIPDTIDGVPVSKIANRAFYDISTFKKIDLGRNVKSIGDYAFTCTEDTIVLTIPDNLTLTRSLTNYTNPIFDYKGVFDDGWKGSFQTIIIPETVTNISDAFISYYYADLYYLQEYSVDENNMYFSDINGVLYNKTQTKLIKYPINKSILEFVVPDTVTEIAKDAFYGLRDESIEYLDLGKNTSYISDMSISSIIHKIKELRIAHDIDYLDSDLSDLSYWSEEPEWKKLYISPDVTSIPAYFYTSSSYLEEINVEEGNKKYFSELGILYSEDKTELIKCPVNTQLKTYSVLNTTKKIDNLAFEKTSLDSVIIPPSVEEIHVKAFLNSKITKIKGYSGSYAEEFAKNYEYEFVDLGEPPVEVKFNYDVNGDGNSNVMDLLFLKKYLLNNK